MDPLQTKQQIENALLATCHQHGVKPLEGSLPSLVNSITKTGVTLSAENGYLEANLPDGGGVVLSAMVKKILHDSPEHFVPSAARGDLFTSRESMEKGSPQDILKAKSEFIKTHGFKAYENLPQSQAAAESRAIVPSTEMNRSQYLQLSIKDRARLAALGGDTIAKIMARTK